MAHVRRVEIRAQGLGADTLDEGFLIVEAIPGPVIEFCKAPRLVEADR